MDPESLATASWQQEFDEAQRTRTANVVCMKWGTLYGPEWVNKLYGMVARNTTWKLRFICLTDDSTGIRPEVECLPLPQLTLDTAKGATGRGKTDPWWNKISLYRTDLADLKGMTLYLDLDVVVVSNIDDLFSFPGRHCMMPVWRPERYGGRYGNSSVTRFFAGREAYIFDRFLSQPSSHWKSEYSNQEQFFVCDSAQALTFFPPEWCVSFKACLPRNGLLRFFARPELPEAAKIIVFFGANTPEAALRGEINPKKRWSAWKRLSIFRRRFRPPLWLAAAWRE